MKKIISLLSALTMIAAFPLSTSANAQDTELAALADSLGAQTDCLMIPNFKYFDDENIDPSTVIYDDFFRRCSVLEATYSPESQISSALLKGSDMGIAILEVLTHNGVITPDDIQKGADSLKDITRDDNTVRIIEGYQMQQAFTHFNNYITTYLNSKNSAEQTDALITAAEQSMKENKYFLINMYCFNEKIQEAKIGNQHSFCGIGIEDGKWSWNEKEYDKCILTLDSNASGFDENYCIYINSKDHTSCIPAYGIYSEDWDPLMYVAITDDGFLNYKGMINPSDSISKEISDLTFVLPGVSIDGKPETHITGRENAHYEIRDLWCSKDIRRLNTDRWIDIQLSNAYQRFTYNCDVDISDDVISIKNTGDDAIDINGQIRMSEGTYDFTPYYWWYFNTSVNGEFSTEIKDNGILFKTDKSTELDISAGKWTLDDEGIYPRRNQSSIATTSITSIIQTANNVLVTVDSNDDFRFFIDDNGDGIYDAPVQTGDINCDGKISASDASQVLSLYSRLSTTRYLANIVNNPVADMNGDGKINSIDASDILSKYAELSTSHR